MARLTVEARARVRERLLRAAATRFAADGFDAANINTISLEARLAKGTVYNYFSSKEELFGEVIRTACERAVELWSRAPSAGSLEERLRALAAADVQVLREQEPFMKVLVREAMSFRPGTYSLILTHLAPFLEAVTECLREGASAGRVRDDLAPEQLALIFVGMLSLFYVQHWGSEGTWPPLENVPELVVTLFLQGAGRSGQRSPESNP